MEIIIIVLAALAFIALGLGAARLVPDPLQNTTSRSAERSASQFATVPDGEGQYRRRATREICSDHGKTYGYGFSPGSPYAGTAGPVLYTETKVNSATIAYGADGLELKFQAAPSANDNDGFKVVPTKVLTQRASGKPAVWTLDWDVYVDNIIDIGWQAWWATSSSTDLWAADAADQVLVQKAKAANTYSIRCAENGNAAKVANITLPSTPAVNVINQFSLLFEVGTATDGSDSILEIWMDGLACTISGVDGLAALKQVLYTMFTTTVPTLTAGFTARLNGTTQRKCVVRCFDPQVD